MKKRTVLFIVVALLLAFALIIGGIAAYFTDTETATNKFTIGNVDITLTEPNWSTTDTTPQNGVPDAAENLVPGAVVAKDPTVTVTATSNDAYIFVKVEIPNYPNNAATPVNTDLFTLCDGTGTSATPGVNSGWVLLEDKGVSNNVHTYVYAYGSATTATSNLTKVTAGNSTVPVFDSVKLTTDESVASAASTAMTNASATSLDVKVTAYAVQADNITEATPAAIYALFPQN